MAGFHAYSSRRRVLAGMAGSAMFLGADAFAAEPDPRTASVVAGTIAVDMHSHIRIRIPDPAHPAPEPEVDLAGEIRRAGFSAVCQTWNVDEPGDDYAYAQKALDYEDRLLAQNHMRRALTMRDIQTAHDRKEPIIIQTAEGTQFLQGRLARLEEFRARGLRHVQLLHERDDAVAPLGDVYTVPAHLGGLTPFGADVIRECNRLGLLVDLAHGTEATVAGALRATRQPFIISHGGLSRDAVGKNVTPDIQRRLLGDDIAKAVGDAGGVIGVWWRLFTSVGDYVTGIRNRVAAFGVDHVGIGTDTNLMERYILPHTNQIWPDQSAGFFYAVADEMLRQGFSPADIAKIGGGNFCRVFAQAMRA